jgi:hypothetical protein
MSPNNPNKSLKVDLKVLKEGKIQVKITNISSSSLDLYSHVKAGEKLHYDFFELEAKTPDYEHIYGIDFIDNRDKAYPVVVQLKPNTSFSHTINLVEWSEKEHNKQTLWKYAQIQSLPQKCGIKIRIKYYNSQTEEGKRIWQGYAYSDWVSW